MVRLKQKAPLKILQFKQHTSLAFDEDNLSPFEVFD